MFEDEIIDYLAKYNGFSKDYKNLFPSKEETIALLMKITLPNELKDSFYSMEKNYLSSLNKRFEYQEAKKLKYVDNMSSFYGNVSKIKGDVLINPLITPIYNPQNLMAKEINDELIRYGGLEIRRDLLEENAKRNKPFEEGDSFLGKAYFLPYKKLLTFKLPSKVGTSIEEINNLSKELVSLFEILKKERPHYVVIASKELDIRLIEFMIKTFHLLLKTLSYDINIIFVTDKENDIKEIDKTILNLK